MKTVLTKLDRNGFFSEYLLEMVQNTMKLSFNKSVRSVGRIKYWSQHIEDYIRLFYMLEDEESKWVFLRLLEFEIGMTLVGDGAWDMLSLYPSDIWRGLCKKAENIPHVNDDYMLDRVETFILEGYNYKDICCASIGDIVFDCGTFTGNTVKYFSERVGEKGRVYAFEPMPESYAKLRDNMKDIGVSNAVLENMAISDGTKILHFTNDSNPASKAVNDENGIQVNAISIDDYCKKNSINKVDFIKMDIEGSEMEALDGCKWVCKEFCPKLAICIYHKWSDFIDIPKKILQLNNNYVFYIKHNSNQFNETVLFAYPSTDRKNIVLGANDVAISKKMLDFVIDLYDKKEMSIRKRIMYSYVHRLHAMIDIPLEVKYHERFAYAYMPLSDDGRLHYEFLHDGDKMLIALHFEGGYISKANIIDKKSLEMLSTKLLARQLPYRYEIAYILPNPEDVELATCLMKYLIEKTYPVLLDNGLISDRIRFKKMMSL